MRLAVGIIAFVAFNCTAWAQNPNSPQALAQLMRPTLPPDAKCQWNAYGKPSCEYDGIKSGDQVHHHLSLFADETNNIIGMLSTQPASDDETMRVTNILFSFFDKLGWPTASQQQCLSSLDRNKSFDQRDVDVGGWIATCSRQYYPPLQLLNATLKVRASNKF